MLEIYFYRNEYYKYSIERIEINEEHEKRFSYIYYKMAGSRGVRKERTSDLDSSNVFSLFKPEHAKMIVSISTIEALSLKKETEILDQYNRYIEFCNTRFRGDL